MFQKCPRGFKKVFWCRWEFFGGEEKISQNKPEWVRKGGLGERGDVVVREIGGRFIKIIHWAIPLNAKANPLAFRQ